MNLAYQLNRHFTAHMRQWPDSDPRRVRRDILRLLRTGQAWLYREPVQMELPL